MTERPAGRRAGAIAAMLAEHAAEIERIGTGQIIIDLVPDRAKVRIVRALPSAVIPRPEAAERVTIPAGESNGLRRGERISTA